MENDETSLSVEDAKWLWSNRRWIAERAKQLAEWFWPKPIAPDAPPQASPEPRGILMIGPGGVGKTTFARFVSGERDILTIWGAGYDESLGIETYQIPDPPTEIVVPPGQSHRRDTTWPEIEASLAAGRYRGVVLLVSYGYHSLGRTSYKRHRLYKGDDEAFLRDYLADRRKDELAVLERISPHLRAAPESVWLLTVVTKQDLWWPERDAVEPHYRAGRFGAAVEEIRQTRGAKNFRQELVLASLTISNFQTGEKELLKENTAGYDSQRQIQSLHQLLQTLDALRTWEGTSK
jgi:hypothetical protein